MEYRIAFESDKAQLFSLWEEAFGDGRETVKRFFDTVIKTENTFVADNGDGVVSALYLIEADILTDKKKYKACYIYAAATQKRFRKMGIMSKLIEFAQALAVQRKADYLFLRPASEALYGYYAANGFRTAFYEKEQEITEDYDFIKLPFVQWDKDVCELDAYLSEGEAFFGENGYACFDICDNALRVSYYVSRNPKELFRELSDKYGIEKVFAFVPAYRDEKNAFKTGMIKRINENAVEIDSAYLGISME